MKTQQYLDEMQKIQYSLLEFLENESNSEEQFQNLKEIFNEYKITDDHYKLKSLLYLVTKIANNHHRGQDFFSKIDQVLNLFKNDIKKYFSNFEIFNIFKGNKRIILFLITEQILNFDENIAKEITTKAKYKKAKYPQFFAPEVKSFINENWLQNEGDLIEEIKQEVPDNFYELRKTGENDCHIFKLIQKDLVKDFIAYINQNNISLKTTIKPNIYETNSFLTKKEEISLIEYAAFFGSIQIFQYLQIEGVKLEQSLWPFAIHGANAELIHLLEDNNINPKDKSFENCFVESIKCHHNDVANFFLNNLTKYEIVDSYYFLSQSIKYRNFAFMQNNQINQSSFIDLCKYDYYVLVDALLESNEIDVNQSKIYKKKLF